MALSSQVSFAQSGKKKKKKMKQIAIAKKDCKHYFFSIVRMLVNRKKVNNKQ